MTNTLSMAGEDLDILVPLPLNTYGASIETSIQHAIDLHQRTGFGKFILSGPSKGWRSIGYPPRDHFEQLAADIVRFKEGVRGYDIAVGWWAHMTLKTGPAPFQRIVNLDGLACLTSTCPLDAGFQERYSGDVALIAEAARPELIIFEDDFGLNCHNGPGCFCDLHLRFFAERIGRFHTREELRDIVTGESESQASRRREWADMSRDSLVQLAARVRQAVDRVTPWIPMGSMQPGCADRDGDSTEAVARAFAGDQHRPFVRLYGTSYGSDDAFSLPTNVFHALYCRQHLPADVLCYHESDTYPHNCFFMSAGKMRSLMGAVYSYGFAGSTFQACQELDDPNEEAGYYAMFVAERKRFQAANALARRCEVVGCGLLAAPNRANDWVAAFAHFGIPYSTRESTVNLLSGTLPDSFSDQQITRLLKQGLLLDGEAAARLCARGFGAAMGVSVEGISTILDANRDIEGRERIRDEFTRDEKDGRLMAWYSTYSPYGNGNMHHLVPNDASTEIITELLNFSNETIGVGMTRYVNPDGGRVVVMGMSVTGNLSSSLFNYRRARLIQDLVVWAGATEIVYVRNQPRVFCIQNRLRKAGDENVKGFVTLINLCSDTCESIELHVPNAWLYLTTVEFLDADGEWVKSEHEFLDQAVRINHSLQLYHPLYLRFAAGRA